MSRRAVIDFESYYSEDISAAKMCLQNYYDKSEEFGGAYLISMVCEGFKFVGSIEEFKNNEIVVRILFDPEIDLFALNSNFDQGWMSRHFPELDKQWNCIADYAVYHQRPRNLEAMSPALLKKPYSKKIRGQMKGVDWISVMEFEKERIRQYNLDDSIVENKCLDALEVLGPMSDSETQIAAHTRAISRKGIAFDEEFLRQSKNALEVVKFNARKQIPWRDKEKIMSPGAFGAWCCKKGVAPPSNLKKDDVDLLAWREMNPTLSPMLDSMKQWSVSNNKISHIDKFFARTKDGTFYPELLYCGAPHTRRWSSRGANDGELHSAFNVQNMDKSPLFPSLLPKFFSPLPTVDGRTGKPIAGVFLRNALVPRPGKKFLIFDFNQIEPRCLNYLAGNWKFLKMVSEIDPATGKARFSLYEAFARSIGMWTDSRPLDTTNPNLYRLVKNIVIGAGYGMSGKRFCSYVKTTGKMNLSLDKSIEIIRDFRARAPLLTGFWRNLHDLVEGSWRSGTDLEIVMPNGETMWQFDIQQEMYTYPDGGVKPRYTAKKIFECKIPKISVHSTHGAKLSENVSSRMGRDVMADAILRLESAGIPCLFHAHDEMILEVDADNAEDACKETERIASMSPTWAPLLPISVEGGIYDRYTKV